MKFSDFLLKESVDDEVVKGTGNLEVFLQDEDSDDENKVKEFIKSLRDKGIYLGKAGKDSNPMYRTFDDAEFGKEIQDDEKFDWSKFVRAVRKTFDNFDAEVGINGNFKVDGKEYNFDTDEDTIYFDNQ